MSLTQRIDVRLPKNQHQKFMEIMQRLPLPNTDNFSEKLRFFIDHHDDYYVLRTEHILSKPETERLCPNINEIVKLETCDRCRTVSPEVWFNCPHILKQAKEKPVGATIR